MLKKTLLMLNKYPCDIFYHAKLFFSVFLQTKIDNHK